MQLKVSIRVDRATELGAKISRSVVVRLSPGLNSVADWLPKMVNSAASWTRIETFGWTDNEYKNSNKTEFIFSGFLIPSSILQNWKKWSWEVRADVDSPHEFPP